MLISPVVYCLLGVIAGALVGLLGVGGGIVVIPMLVFAFGWQNFPPDILTLMVLGMSMGSIMFTSISSSLAYSRNKGVQRNAIRNIIPGILIDTFCGSFLASHVPVRFPRPLFVAFLFFVTTQMLSDKEPKPSRHLPDLGSTGIAGEVIGVVSNLMGIGGGTLSVSFLLWNNLNMRKAIGASVAIGFSIVLTGCFDYIADGWNATNLSLYSFGYTYLPNLLDIVVVSMLAVLLGARLAQILPVPRLKKRFTLLFIVTGIGVLLKAL